MDSNGIGLLNVINRLNLYYKKEGIFTIKSEGKDMGTEVVLGLDLYYEGEEHMDV